MRTAFHRHTRTTIASTPARIAPMELAPAPQLARPAPMHDISGVTIGETVQRKQATGGMRTPIAHRTAPACPTASRPPSRRGRGCRWTACAFTPIPASRRNSMPTLLQEARTSMWRRDRSGISRTRPGMWCNRRRAGSGRRRRPPPVCASMTIPPWRAKPIASRATWVRAAALATCRQRRSAGAADVT